ncbi:Predicted arabinose efflux permease, MFS family [Propionibacterium cyclohexanicum]|uniref:Predicted arabinose efflux permease, MFS family n=1 Tax=Propionibacterium cyclohexanicum TaxID=64702 RepID=A0A1H9TM89_9ACTN|nr:MFS transporter [Propionibacterium cyclohexanicum]SER98266.1 Predicted arabinose efflux permease, MFS family [Propionibacterium cyclohexanicum]
MATRNHSLGKTLFGIYGPTLLASIGFGAVIPLVAIQARDLGASVGLAAFITALRGIAQVVGDLPAGILAELLGERIAIAGACFTDAVTMALIFLTHSLPVLAIAVFLQGFTASVFNLARQTYLTENIPLHWRARAMSSLGGVFRVGWFVGPLISAAVVNRWSMPVAFAFSGLMSFGAGLVTLFMPNLPGETAHNVQAIRQRRATHHMSTWSVLRKHSHVLLTMGTGCMALMLIRSVRQTIIPLWAEAHGVSPAATSLIYSISMAFDVLLFFPGGAIMDAFGRWWVTIPAISTMSVCLLLMPLTHSFGTITLVACILGIGNGLSSGIVLTLGSDFSPEEGRAAFLAGWRMLSDSGSAMGPLIISGVAAVAGLATSSLVVGLLGLAGAGWLAKYVPRTGTAALEERARKASGEGGKAAG